jgi:hypothetical protein
MASPILSARPTRPILHIIIIIIIIIIITFIFHRQTIGKSIGNWFIHKPETIHQHEHKNLTEKQYNGQTNNIVGWVDVGRRWGGYLVYNIRDVPIKTMNKKKTEKNCFIRKIGQMRGKPLLIFLPKKNLLFTLISEWELWYYKLR